MTNETVRRFEVELVEEAPPVPKGPPLAGDRSAVLSPSGDGPPALLNRKRDYLDGFLAEQAPAADAGGGESLQDAVVAALRDIFDPEIPVNIYDLGLIYGVDIVDGHATVTMTLTTPHCPVAETMPGEVEMRVMAVPGIATAEVKLVWEPAWNPASMSDEARLELGML